MYTKISPLFLAQHTAESRIIRFEYYTLDGRKLQTPQVGISIRRSIFADGHFESDSVIKKM